MNTQQRTQTVKLSQGALYGETGSMDSRIFEMSDDQRKVISKASERHAREWEERRRWIMSKKIEIIYGDTR